ncbi:probable cysteine desulfurase, partial [Watersipora subatra]|uniref:probable cysteine desulfurase n=1 Tax=Watersipora subatra TaxID=2589382 RepID=UPI00355C2428
MGSGASSAEGSNSRLSSTISSASSTSSTSLRVTVNPNYTTMMKSLHDSIMGDGVVFQTIFGEKRALYLDYTASGRPVRFVEDYIANEVCHRYANTHTSTCLTARQTSLSREGSRSYIKKCVNANEDDVLLFTGSGVTGAIHKLVSVLCLDPAKTVVLIGPYEHHSNILPWKESGATVHTISQTHSGQLDLYDLENKVIHSAGKTVIGSFSAASNVTGIISDVKRVTRLLKKYGALSFWDYATGAPYLNIDLNHSKQGSIDAVFISPHKFLGGPQTPGLLIAKKHLFKNKVPVITGGGTVNYVYSEGHEYLSDIEAREEGGTPSIIESIRASLAFKIKHSVGLRQLEEREAYLYQTGKTYWGNNCPHMLILGCGSVHRLPIFSFIVTHPTVSKLIHHNFIATLLNDLYGIQTRGGCACAGPYGEALLGINAQYFISYFKNGIGGPGFCRLNLPFTMSEEELSFTLEAVRDVSEYGWRLLPLATLSRAREILTSSSTDAD